MAAMTGTEAELEHVRAQYGRAMDTVRTMTAEIDALHGKSYAMREQLAQVTAERDSLRVKLADAKITELEAQLAAVPVDAIRELIFGEDGEPFSSEDIANTNAVATWLETQVTR